MTYIIISHYNILAKTSTSVNVSQKGLYKILGLDFGKRFFFIFFLLFCTFIRTIENMLNRDVGSLSTE